MVFWSLSIIVSIVFLVLSAAARDSGVHMAYAHMSIAAAVSIGFALIFIRESEAMRMAGARASVVAGNTARFMGIVWAWGALSLAVTYGTGILHWREWLHFFLACCALAAICLFFSTVMSKDAEKDKDDENLLKIGRYLTILQFAGMILAMIGMLIDGKMTRYLTPRFSDWAANHIFFFGALAIAVISGYSLTTKPRKSKIGV